MIISSSVVNIIKCSKLNKHNLINLNFKRDNYLETMLKKQKINYFNRI